MHSSVYITKPLPRRATPPSFMTSKNFVALLASVMFCAIAVSISFAQQTGAVLGQPSLQKYINVGGGVDEINTGDLTVHVSIPLASKGSYGPTVSTSLDMDSRTYMYNYQLGQGNQIFTNGGFSFRSNVRQTLGFGFTPGSGSCTTTPYPQLAAWPAYDGSGTFHPAFASVVGCGGGVINPPGNNGDGWALGVALASSPYYPYWNYFGVVIAPSGLWSGTVFPPQGSAPCLPYNMYDLHANVVTDNICWGSNSSGVVTTASGSVVDAANNPVLTATFSQNNVVLLQYPGPNGATATYKLTFSPYTLNQDFGCGLPVPGASTAPFLTRLDYPDGSFATFSYEANQLHTGTITGRISSITVPTGATYGYVYTGGTHGVNCSDGSTSGIRKTTPDGTWALSHTAETGGANLSTTTITAPSGDYTVDTIAAVLPNPNTPYVIPQTSTVATLSYSSSGALLSSKYFCYGGNHPTSPLSCANPSSAPAFAPSEIDTWTYVPGVPNPSLEVRLFDAYLRVTDAKTYDFGGTIGGSNYDTDVQTAYGSWNGNLCTNITNTITNFGTYNLMDRVCYKKTFISGNPNPVAATYYTYGSLGNSLGELIAEKALIGGTLVTVDARTYDSLGRVLTSTGPNGEQTTSTYAQCSGQHLSATSAKANTSGSTLGATYSGYDCVGEKATITTDANTKQSWVNYGTDPFWRPVSTTDAANNVTTYTYTPAIGTSPATVDVQRTIASGSSEETLTQFDAMGRTQLTQVRQGPSSSQWTITETDYDSNGRVRRVTLPYSGPKGTTNSTIDGTITTYDGLGRKSTVTTPAYNGTTPGSTLTYQYIANDVLVTQSPAPTGEHTKARQTERNGLGQVTSVCEVNTISGSSSCAQSTSATGFKTAYTYYPGGKLHTITQYANGASQQVRSFTYDNNNTGRVLTMTTPESGTSTTTYDSDPSGLCPSFIGFAVKAVNNGGGTACFQYDLADRVISEKFMGLNSQATPPKQFVYDSSTSSHLSCSTPNAAGKLVEISTGSSGTATVTIGGNEQSVTSGTPSTGSVNLNIYLGQLLTGQIVINVNGSVAGSYNFASGMSGGQIAPPLSSNINGNSGAPVTSTYQGGGTGPGTIYLTSKTKGSNTNYPLSATCQSGGSSCSSYISTSGSTMTGGTGSGLVYDTGSVWITINGVQTSVSYGQNSTSVTVATALVNAINGNSALPVTASLSGSTVNLLAKSGSSLNGLTSGSSTSQPSTFTNPSFSASDALGFGSLASDELFCYDPVGRKSDTYLWTSNGYNSYGHISESYYPNGDPETISWDASSWPTPTPPTINYAPDPMGRPYSVTDGNGTTLVTSTSYYLNNGINTVLFGNGDKSVYTQYANSAPNTATHTIGTTANNTVNYTPTWNSNGTLGSLQTIDNLNPANSQTCTFSYDDLIRISTDNCAATSWSESFTYDPFGNITKSGSLPWPPSGVTYNSTNNQYYKSSGNPFVYDANGRLLSDTFDSLAWDVNGNLISQTGTSFQYDAFDRPISSTVAGVTTSYIYAPDGLLIATLSGSNHSFSQLFVGLPASRAVYTGSSLTLSHIDHYDWQNSARISSTWGRTPYDDVSYDAFGVAYWSSGAATKLFSGLNGDVSSGTEFVSQSRRYHPSQGRWQSPDDRIPDLYDPQSFNAYAYVNNWPTGNTDPSGHEPFLTDPSTGEVSVDLNGMTVYYAGQLIDQQDPNFELLYKGASVTCTVGDVCNIGTPPITTTDYQDPIIIPSPQNDSSDIPPTILYPSQMSQSDLKEVDRQLTTINAISTLGGALAFGAGGGLASVSGAGFELPQLTTVGPTNTVDACLVGCLNRAILAVNNRGLTQAQALAVAKNPEIMPAMVGNQIDEFFKAEVRSAISTGELPNSFQVTPRFKFGPDVYDTASGRWWDVTTPGQWGRHVSKYSPGYGAGTPLFYGPVNTFAKPLHFVF